MLGFPGAFKPTTYGPRYGPRIRVMENVLFRWPGIDRLGEHKES